MPFRAVATDLETGEAVVMDEGDLTSAMRASLSAPGVFSPVEREGRLLVDGGLSENLPIDVARSMDVDVLIVVDVGSPLVDRTRLDSVPAISNQMLAILIRRDSKRQRELLNARDIVIDPPLGDASSFDFGHRQAQSIDAGEKAARDAQHAARCLFRGSERPIDQYVARKGAARGGAPQHRLRAGGRRVRALRRAAASPVQGRRRQAARCGAAGGSRHRLLRQGQSRGARL